MTDAETIDRLKGMIVTLIGGIEAISMFDFQHMTSEQFKDFHKGVAKLSAVAEEFKCDTKN